MTEEELKQAAIELCKIRGRDPYQEIQEFYTKDSGNSGVRFIKLWEAFTSQIKMHNEIQTAIRRADTKAVVGYEELFSKFVSDAREQAENDE